MSNLKLELKYSSFQFKCLRGTFIERNVLCMCVRDILNERIVEYLNSSFKFNIIVIIHPCPNKFFKRSIFKITSAHNDICFSVSSVSSSLFKRLVCQYMRI